MKMLDPILQAQAVASLKETLTQLGEGEDTELLLGMIEGETNFLEVVDLLIAERSGDLAMAEAVKAQISDLGARKQRFEKRAEMTKTLIEQAFLVSGIDAKVQRPCATLFLSKRPGKVVVETESDIPVDFWKAGDPVLDGKGLGEHLKARTEAFNLIFTCEVRAAAAQAFISTYLGEDRAKDFLARLDAYFALPIPIDVAEKDTPEAALAMQQHKDRSDALMALRRDFAGVPGAYLAEPSRTLSIRVA